MNLRNLSECITFWQKKMHTAGIGPQWNASERGRAPTMLSVLSPKYEYFAGGSAAADFSRRERSAHILSHTGRSVAAEEKQPSGAGPEGCDENGLATALLVGHVSVQSFLLARKRKLPNAKAAKNEDPPHNQMPWRLRIS